MRRLHGRRRTRLVVQSCSDCFDMAHSGWLLSAAPEVWPDIIVQKSFLVGRTKQQEVGKTPCSFVLMCRR